MLSDARLLATAALLPLLASVADAQPTALKLRPPTATLAHEFSRISAVRELTDGRLLITDTDDGLLLVADSKAGAVRPIASKGAGPGEYRDLGALIPLRGDTTLMPDASNRRALLLQRDSVIRTLATDDPLIVALGTDLIGASGDGRILGLRRLPPTDAGASRRRDVLALLSWRDAKVDTIAHLRAIEMATTASGTPPHQTLRTMTAIMSSPEQAVVFPNGDVAIALQDPYRVEWHLANGDVRRGTPIERTAPRIDAAEQRAWKQRNEEWSGRPLNIDLDAFAWADLVPPFQQGGLTALPDGRLLLAREPWSGGADGMYDLVDRTGARVAMLRLGAGSRVVGTGRGAVYVASRTDDGTERLSRHPWP